MTDSLELAVARPQTLSISDQMAFAREVAEASIIPEAYRRSPANILIAVGFGQSMGLSPSESLYRINVIQGKPTMGAELIAAQVRKAGHKLRLVKDEGKQSVTCTIVRADDPQYPISVTRDKEWAKGMGLAGKDNYRKQPMTMLTWRAITACAREACPEALYGVAYTPDEMHDIEDVAPTTPTVPQAPAADLSPVRSRYKAWCAATGMTPKAGAEAICRRYGAPSMDGLTQEQVDDAARTMDAEIAEASTTADVDHETGEVVSADVALYGEDVEF